MTRSRAARGWVIGCVVALGVLVGGASPAWALKVMFFNLLRYPGTTAAQRNPHFQTIIADVQPDILVTCEVQGSSAATTFRSQVLNVVNPAGWLQDTHVVCGDTDQALFYRIPSISTAGTGLDRLTVVSTSPRATPRWKLRPRDYTHPDNTFYVYGTHLKAGSTASDQSDRAAAAALIRTDANGLAAGARILLAGDMNLYTSSEAAYGSFTGSQANDNGRVNDIRNPSLVVQNWSLNSTFRFFHTQSPRTVAPPGQNDGGVLGGLDDRFDFIFVSPGLMTGIGMSYITNSYREYGQDGNRFNQAVNNPLPNGNVSNAIADALYFASDHLPVLLELTTPARAAVGSTTIDFGQVIVDGIASRTLSVSNTAPPPGETLQYAYVSQPPGHFTGPFGPQFRPAGPTPNVDTIEMLTGTVGVKDLSPALVINTNSLETPQFSINATGTVLAHAVPSTESASQVLSGTVDFGAHPPGGFTNQTAEAHNVGYSSLQALLRVTDAVVSGPDAARFSVLTPVPQDAGMSAASFTIAFDDSGATPGTFTATLTLTTRDQDDLEGWIDLDDLTYALSATIPLVRGDFNYNGVVDCPDVAPFIAVLLDPGSATPAELVIADMNEDTLNDGRDIQLFVAALVCP